MLYIVKLSNTIETIIKIGFTKHNTTSKRFQPYRKVFDKVEVIKLFTDSKVDYKTLEKHFNQGYAVRYKVVPLTRFGGMSECYRVEDAEQLTTLITSLEGSYIYPEQDIKQTPLTKVSDFFSVDEIIPEFKYFITASHWVDPNTEEVVKLTHNVKAVYHYKLDQYNLFTGRGMIYKESAQRVADTLGLSVKVVEEVAIPLLKRMGLITIRINSPRDCITTVYPISYLKGEFINKKIKKYKDVSLETLQEQLKVIKEMLIVIDNISL